MKIAKRITIAHPPLRLNYVASFAIRSIPHYPDGRQKKTKRNKNKRNKRNIKNKINEKCILKNQAKFTTVSSRKINQRPRFKRKIESSPFPFRSPTKKAEVPARKTKTGAQKCVIQRVKNNGTLV